MVAEHTRTDCHRATRDVSRKLYSGKPLIFILNKFQQGLRVAGQGCMREKIKHEENQEYDGTIPEKAHHTTSISFLALFSKIINK
jgi:hypothetical protein